MSKDLVQAGLTVFQSGDIIGATRLWLEARQENPADERAAAYIENVRNLIPDVVAALETEVQVEASPSTLVNLPLDIPDSLDDVPTSVLAPAIPTLGPVPIPVPIPEAPVPLPPLPEALTSGADPWGVGADAMVAMQGAPGLSLVSPQLMPPPAAPVQSLEPQKRRLRELLELDDFSGALDVAEQILQINAVDDEAKQARGRCRERLLAMQLARLGDMSKVPRVKVAPEQVIWLDLDHRAGFVLAQVDGMSTFDEIVEVTGMERLMSLKILAELLNKGVIEA